jgi:transcriptional regulator with XRE-family HTH domain
MNQRALPRAVSFALADLGENLSTWRKLRQLTAQQLADRAGVSLRTVSRLESGNGSNVENLIRVVRALGILDQMTLAFDPFTTDVGRLRADSALPQRVRN